LVWYSNFRPPISRSFWLGEHGLQRHFIALPGQHPNSSWSSRDPIGVSENFKMFARRRRLGLVVLDVGNQVAQNAAEEHANEENAQDWEEPRHAVLVLLSFLGIYLPPSARRR
jgi:hypothetical protein